MLYDPIASRSSNRARYSTYAALLVASLKLQNSPCEVALCHEDALEDLSERDAIFGGCGRKLGVIEKLQITLGYDGSKGKLQVASLLFLNDRGHTQSEEIRLCFQCGLDLKSQYHPAVCCELEMWMRGDEKLPNVGVVQSTVSSEYGACHLCDQRKRR